MRILYLHQYFSSPAMNGGTRSFEMARRLVQRGHSVDLLTTEREGALSGRDWVVTDEDGVKVHWLPVPYSNRMGYAARLKAFARFATAAGARAATLPADVVFATSTPLTIALPAIYAQRRLGVPMVFEVRDLWPAVPIALGVLKDPFTAGAARALERAAYRSARHVVALSPGMRDGILASGVPRDAVTVLPNSCDLALFDVPAARARAWRAERSWLGDRPLVLYAGTLGRVNNVRYFVKLAAAAAAIDPDVRFLVVGHGSEWEQVRAEAGRLGVLDRNFFMEPAVPKSEIATVFAAASIASSWVLPVPALWDNSANKFFDALAAGKPVAINHGGWQADMIEEAGCGLVLAPEEPEGEAARLVAALRDPAWLTRAGAAARRLARERFDRDVLAGELERILVEAVGGPSPTAWPRAAGG